MGLTLWRRSWPRISPADTAHHQLAHLGRGSGTHGTNSPQQTQASDVDVCRKDFPQKCGRAASRQLLSFLPDNHHNRDLPIQREHMRYKRHSAPRSTVHWMDQGHPGHLQSLHFRYSRDQCRTRRIRCRRWAPNGDQTGGITNPDMANHWRLILEEPLRAGLSEQTTSMPDYGDMSSISCSV